MRVTSEFWIAAYVRRCDRQGVPVFVVRRGARDAGAIFVVVNRLDATVDLYGPAPQAVFDAETSGERRFESLLEGVANADAQARINREMDFDPDGWIIEIEDKSGRHWLDLA